jgi:hypothetical protein
VERRSKTIRLTTPIQAHGAEVSELTIYEPQAGDLEAFDQAKGDIQRQNHLLAVCARIPYSSVRTLSMVDWRSAMEALADSGFQELLQQDIESSD